MTASLRATGSGDATKREPTGGNPRALLFFSALMVMMFTGAAARSTTTNVMALLAAGVSAMCALVRPKAVRKGDWQRRAEWALVIVLLLCGLILTAGVLARAFTDLASPAWMTVVAVYTVMGLAGALLVVRRLPHMGWVFALFLVLHVAMTVAFLRSSAGLVDVEVFLRDGAVAVLHGHNPYALTFPDIYPPQLSEQFYGHGVVVNGRVTFGFPYLPVVLLVAVPSQLLGDVRYGQLMAMLVTALILRRLASDRLGQAAAVLGVAAPIAIPMLSGGWTEPTLVALLAALVLALQRRRQRFVAVLLGLFLVSKQYVVIALPLIWQIRAWLSRRVIFVGLGVAAAVTLPFLVVDRAAFWKAIVQYQLIQPFRPDSESLLVASVNALEWPPPWTYGILPLAAGALTAIVLAFRAPRTPAAFAAAFGLTLLVTILLSKEAFMNYYFLVSGAFLIAAVAWPTEQPMAPEQPSASPTISREDR